MAILTLFFYVGHTIFEFSNGMLLKSPVGLDKSFLDSKGTSLFFAIIPVAYLIVRLSLMIVLAKYAAFPGVISLPQALLIAFGLWLPPLLLGIIPYFYSQSIKKLKEILE